MKKHNQKGFTLIEVILVLAIGGLIFLLAFLAFQQVQRNRRDTQRRTDVARMAAIHAEVKSNNSTVTISTACTAGSNWFDAITSNNFTAPSGSYSCVSAAPANTGEYRLQANQVCMRLEAGSDVCRSVE